MMKLKTITLIIFIITVFKTYGQSQKDSIVATYAILIHENSTFNNTLMATFSNNTSVNLINLLKIKENHITGHQQIFKGFTYLDSLGYELISSNSYLPENARIAPTREYVFRKRK